MPRPARPEILSLDGHVSGRLDGMPPITARGTPRRHESHGMTGTPEYQAWRNIMERCLNPNHPHYDVWGGRGVRVCLEWQESFLSFYRHAGPRPGPGYSIDRFPNKDGHYEPGNVRWAT